jgi:hypothetical protein
MLPFAVNFAKDNASARGYMRALWCFPAVVGCLCVGCVHKNPDEPAMTQLQIREIETREFDTKDAKLVMKSMMNVFQDEGFVVKNVVLDLGLISAEKNLDIENKGQAVLSTMVAGANARWAKQQSVEASANISEFGDKIRVRVTFQTKKIDNLGNPISVEKVTNPKLYQEFFDKIGKGIFIQQENI